MNSVQVGLLGSLVSLLTSLGYPGPLLGQGGGFLLESNLTEVQLLGPFIQFSLPTFLLALYRLVEFPPAFGIMLILCQRQPELLLGQVDGVEPLILSSNLSMTGLGLGKAEGDIDLPLIQLILPDIKGPLSLTQLVLAVLVRPLQLLGTSLDVGLGPLKQLLGLLLTLTVGFLALLTKML